jgi:hypothetical protein
MIIKYPGGSRDFGLGECLLIPNVVTDIEIRPLIESKLLETYIL